MVSNIPVLFAQTGSSQYIVWAILTDFAHVSGLRLVEYIDPNLYSSQAFPPVSQYKCGLKPAYRYIVVYVDIVKFRSELQGLVNF